MSKNKFTMNKKDLQQRKNGRQSPMSKNKFTIKNILARQKKREADSDEQNKITMKK